MKCFCAQIGWNEVGDFPSEEILPFFLILAALLLVVFLAMFFVTRIRNRSQGGPEDDLRKFQTALDAVSEGILLVDLRGIVSFANAAARYLTGVGKELQKGAKLESVFPLRCGEENVPIMQLVFSVARSRSELLLPDDSFVVLLDGKSRYLSGGVSPVIFDDGRMNGVILTFRDVTGERARQLELQQSLTRLEFAVRLAGCSSFEFGPGHRLVSGSTARFWPVRDGRLEDPAAFVEPADLGKVSSQWRMLETGEVREIHCSFRATLQGALRYFNLFAARVPGKSDGGHVFGMIQDSTEQEIIRHKGDEYHEILSNVFNRVPIAIGVKDPLDDFRYLYWNKKLENDWLFDFQPMDGRYEQARGEALKKITVQFRKQDEIACRNRLPLVHAVCLPSPYGQRKFHYYQCIKTPIELSGGREILLLLALDVTPMIRQNRIREAGKTVSSLWSSATSATAADEPRPGDHRKLDLPSEREAEVRVILVLEDSEKEWDDLSELFHRLGIFDWQLMSAAAALELIVRRQYPIVLADIMLSADSGAEPMKIVAITTDRDIENNFDFSQTDSASVRVLGMPELRQILLSKG